MTALQQSLSRARSEARKLLNLDGPLIESVPVEGIADKLGIQVQRMEIDSEISGLLKIKGNSGSPVIVINSQHGSERQRFTIAHEIGHFILHPTDAVQIDTQKNGSAVYFRDSKSAEGNQIKEVEANQFAAELLMPTKDLTTRVKKVLDNNEAISSKIPEWARFYKVSADSMMIKVGKIMEFYIPHHDI